MKKRGFLDSPLSMASVDRSPSDSPKKFEFIFNTSFKPTSSSSLKKKNNEGDGNMKKKKKNNEGDGNMKKKNSGGTTNSVQMLKRSTRKSTVAESPVSPSESPKKFEFNFDTGFKPTSSSSLKKNNKGYGNMKKNSGGTTTSALRQKPSTKRNSSAAESPVSPLPTAIPDLSPSESPKKNEFNFSTRFKPISSSSLKKNNKGEGNMKKNSGGTTTSKPMQATGSPPSVTKSLSSLSDLKDLAASRMVSLKRNLDCSYSEITKDIEASNSRLDKGLKVHTQTCLQMMDEAEKEYQKMMEQIDESRDAMKDSYMELIAEAQANASRVCKTSIPELLQSFDKSIDGLRSRYGVASTLQ